MLKAAKWDGPSSPPEPRPLGSSSPIPWKRRWGATREPHPHSSTTAQQQVRTLPCRGLESQGWMCTTVILRDMTAVRYAPLAGLLAQSALPRA